MAMSPQCAPRRSSWIFSRTLLPPRAAASSPSTSAAALAAAASDAAAFRRTLDWLRRSTTARIAERMAARLWPSFCCRHRT